MTRRACALLSLLFAFPLARPPQSVAQTTHRVAFSGGAYHTSLVDPVSSELRYSGGGPAYGLSLARETPRSVLGLTAEYQRSELTSTLTGSENLPREQATMAGVQARRLWAARALAGGWLRPGIVLHGEIAVRDHRYAEPRVAFSYLVGMLAVGPALGWTRPLPVGELRADAVLSLAGIVYRPYSDVESVDGDRLRFRIVAVNRLQAPSGGLSWAVPVLPGGRARALAGWRFSYLRYRDYTVYRQARQNVFAAVELPLGGAW